VGTTETLEAVDGAELATATFSVAPANVANATASASPSEPGGRSREFAVQALAAGTATFALDVSDRALDRINLDAREATRLQVGWAIHRQDRSPQDSDYRSSYPIVATPGQTIFVRVLAFDRDGAELLATRGVDFSSSNGGVLNLPSLDGGAVTSSTQLPDLQRTSTIFFDAAGAGTAELSVTTSAVSTTVPVVIQ
jgi:hypothetical protein